MVLGLAWGLAGCASSSYDDVSDYARPNSGATDRPVVTAGNSAALPRMNGTSRVETSPGQQPLQCVPYAREHSAIKIYGDAWTWWDQASGKYERGQAPASGAVMVLTNYAGPNHGHVAVVKRIVSSREIRIDHANWLNDGSIYVNNPVMDVSAANDWSQVRVFKIQTGRLGLQGLSGAGLYRVQQQSPAR
jgi:surface antigen